MSTLPRPSLRYRRRHSPLRLLIPLAVVLLIGAGFVVVRWWPCALAWTGRNVCAPCQSAGPVTFVLGARGNVPAPVAVGTNVPQLPGRLGEVIREAIDAQQRLLVYRVDGHPSQAFDFTYVPRAQAANPRRDEVNLLADQFLQTISTVRATSPEAAPLRALWLAARDTPPGGTVVFDDSGLQTVEPLDFRREGMLEAIPGDVVERLRVEHEAIPDLGGRRVILMGLGDTAVPQDDLTVRMHNNVVSIWRAIAAAGGAACVETLTDNPPTRDALAGVPPVSPIAVGHKDPPHPCVPIRLSDGGDVGFEPDRDIFVDRRAAKAYLTGIAGTIQERPREPVVVTGTTARRGSEAGQRSLSLQRAEAVKGLLVELGVAADRITTRGDGSYGPFYRPDNGPVGPLDPANAAFNRSVYIQVNCQQTQA